MGFQFNDLQESLEQHFEQLISCLSPQQRSEAQSITLAIRTAWTSLVEGLHSQEGTISQLVELSEKLITDRQERGTNEGPVEVDTYSLPITELTTRQLEIFRLIGEAKGTSEIAKHLHLSVHTVETHRENIKRKLGLKSSQHLIRAAVLLVTNQAKI